jgi:hypothetical protein
LLALLLIVSINGPFDDLCLTNLVVKEGKRWVEMRWDHTHTHSLLMCLLFSSQFQQTLPNLDLFGPCVLYFTLLVNQSVHRPPVHWWRMNEWMNDKWSAKQFSVGFQFPS